MCIKRDFFVKHFNELDGDSNIYSIYLVTQASTSQLIRGSHWGTSANRKEIIRAIFFSNIGCKNKLSLLCLTIGISVEVEPEDRTCYYIKYSTFLIT